jgi:hypothetical protein
VTVVELVGGVDVVMAVELLDGARVASVDVVGLPPHATNATVQSAQRTRATS